MPFPQLPVSAQLKVSRGATKGGAHPGPQGNRRSQGLEEVEGQQMEHWVEERGPERVHVYFTLDPRCKLGEAVGSAGAMADVDAPSVPRRLTDTEVIDGVETPLMTYDLLNVQLGPQVSRVISLKDLLPSTWAISHEVLLDRSDEVIVTVQDEALFTLPAQHSHESCAWHIGGFPYIHAFHHYLRF
jgi:hypothetical protein